MVMRMHTEQVGFVRLQLGSNLSEHMVDLTVISSEFQHWLFDMLKTDFVFQPPPVSWGNG